MKIHRNGGFDPSIIDILDESPDINGLWRPIKVDVNKLSKYINISLQLVENNESEITFFTHDF